MNTYLLELVLIDIYGVSASLDITLIVENALTTPTSIVNCYFEDVVPQGSAFDVFYIVGTLKQNKLHFEAPLNSLNANCQPLMGLSANLTDPLGNLLPLPSFMSLDVTNRVLTTFITKSDAPAYLG